MMSNVVIPACFILQKLSVTRVQWPYWCSSQQGLSGATTLSEGEIGF